jgi:lysophospholipase L1-like esterase
MDSDPSQIPVRAIPFEHGLYNFARCLRSLGPAKIVAIGSSTTAGEGGIVAYPYRLEALLRGQYHDLMIDVLNRGIGGQDAPVELARFETDVIAEEPDLVIWQVGTNAVWQPPDQHPPTFDETTDAIRKGLARLREYGKADVILMDLQYVPAVLTPAKRENAVAMVRAIRKIAGQNQVNVFRRFALMKGWHEIEKVSFDRMVDPGDPDRLHASDWTTTSMAWALKEAIVGGVAKAYASGALYGT